MKKRFLKLSACCLMSGIMLAGMGGMQAGATEAQQTETAAAEATADSGAADNTGTENTAAQEMDAEAATEETEAAEAPAEESAASETEAADRTGEMVFAQCNEYINVRSAANTDSEVVAKMYNNDSATVIGQEGDWYQIQSGNAVGYVKAEYFATGADAEAIASEVAYNVAVVHPDELNVRIAPGEDTEVIDVAYSAEELEVVAYDGDWMKVALGNDVYGYVNAYYVDYKTYYPTAETIEEEQARLAEEAAAAEAAAYAEQETYTEDVYTEDSYTEEVYTENTYTEETYTEEAYTEDTYTEETSAEDATWTDDSQSADDNLETWTEEEYQNDQTAEETLPEDIVYEETQEAPEIVWEEEAPQTEAPQTEAPQTEAPQTEAPQTEETEAAVSDSSVGQQIVDYAMQFVGNPYVWGGTSLTEGADCSGFTQSVFANFGIGLARVAADQSYGGTAVDISSIQPGDLLFYSDGSSISHVAIYAGNGTIVHASNPESGITTSAYNYSTPVAARRYW
ncbi:MAG TPA: C40 family peptidase [Candidatus Choladousia intestinipullorum]|nr:C40 family peptidase [Candidatus Choladousia intestinipullorum]